jgi:tetraacyldisaccharide 4'-kinase
LLRAAEWPYTGTIRYRNARYDRNGPTHVARVPVISVGNITVGGTGKTPFVIQLVRRLTDMGRKPGVVARGYKASAHGPNDEELLIRRRCPHVIYVADADRSRGCEDAVRQGADVIILDDGFQHRRLARDLDIVLIDATCPFGYGHLLPRGLLREPIQSLRRANAVAITRADQVDAAELERIRHLIHAATKPVPILQCRHLAIEVVTLEGQPLEVRGLNTALMAGIARPAAFAATVRGLGAEVVSTQWWPDHHRYSEQNLRDVLTDYDRSDADLLLTTEKDAVKIEPLLKEAKLSRVAVPWHPHRLDKKLGVVRVGIDFLGDGSTILRELLEQAVSRRE